MKEQSKAAKRRFNDGYFHSQYFVGNGIDVGSGDDSLASYARVFSGIKSIREWDKADGDAQYLSNCPDNSYDFLHSSHCLEHMVDVSIAMQNWARVVKSGGFLIVTVPDFGMYENNVWPSEYNKDHKWAFSMQNLSFEYAICVPKFFSAVPNTMLHKVQLITEFFSPLTFSDQTLLPNPECCIEIVLQKT